MNAATPQIGHAIAQWVAEGEIDLAGDVLDRARKGVADTIACIVAGAGDEGAAAVRQTAVALGNGPATVIGTSTRLAAPWAALANGTAAHALDYDDVFAPGSNHASAVLIPALLALAEAEGATGRQLLDAYVAGLEVQAVLGRGIGRGHYDVGWHNTSTIGCIGAAAGCARLLGLATEPARDAIALAVSMASGPKVQFGSPAKPFHAGLGAQHAVLAADLARNGVHARADAIEGERGFIDLFAGSDQTDWPSLLDRLGAPLAMTEFGVSPKLYPCCGSTHRVLDGVLALRSAHQIALEDVEHVSTLVGYGNKRNLCYPDPQDEMEARFSMNYCVAVALAQGKLSLGDFTAESIHRPELREFLPRVSMDARPADAEGDDPASRLPHEVVIHLKDGSEVRIDVLDAKGSVTNPLTQGDVEEKFIDCCTGFLAPDDLAAAQAALARFDSLEHMEELTRHLAFEATSDRGERFARRAA